jgi:hypothetical protein
MRDERRHFQNVSKKSQHGSTAIRSIRRDDDSNHSGFRQPRKRAAARWTTQRRVAISIVVAATPGDCNPRVSTALNVPSG